MPTNKPEYQRRYHREHYERNRDRYLQQAKDQRNAMRGIVRSQKEKPCADCGVQYPYYVMQFDHVTGVKEATISRRTVSWGASKLLAEIAKCEVVCANCHAVRTYRRQAGNE